VRAGSAPRCLEPFRPSGCARAWQLSSTSDQLRRAGHRACFSFQRASLYALPRASDTPGSRPSSRRRRRGPPGDDFGEAGDLKSSERAVGARRGPHNAPSATALVDRTVLALEHSGPITPSTSAPAAKHRHLSGAGAMKGPRQSPTSFAWDQTELAGPLADFPQLCSQFDCRCPARGHARKGPGLESLRATEGQGVDWRPWTASIAPAFSQATPVCPHRVCRIGSSAWYLSSAPASGLRAIGSTSCKPGRDCPC